MQDIYKLIKTIHNEEPKKSKVKADSPDYLLASFKVTKSKRKRKPKQEQTTPTKQYRNEQCRIKETSI